MNFENGSQGINLQAFHAGDVRTAAGQQLWRRLLLSFNHYNFAANLAAPQHLLLLRLLLLLLPWLLMPQLRARD